MIRCDYGGGGKHIPPPRLFLLEVTDISKLTQEQIDRAKAWDLFSYLETYEPHELKKCGPREYCTRTHDSLKISNGKWCWNSRGIGGRTALDYLMKVRGLSFVGAVETLCGYTPPPQPEQPKPKPPKPFALPQASRCPSAVVPYLQGRGIDPEIIGACMQAGILYESRRYQNCVFVGQDVGGRPRFASLRGTRDKFRMDVEGSDKRYNFCLSASAGDCPRVAVAESPIDALSLASLVKLTGGVWQECSYLALGGTAPRALIQFLHDHPHVTQVSLCLDNDKAGLAGMERLEQAIRDDPALAARVKVIHRNPPPPAFGKDYNEFLTAQVSAAREQKKQQQRRDEAR